MAASWLVALDRVPRVAQPHRVQRIEVIRAIVFGGQPTFAAWTMTMHSLNRVPRVAQPHRVQRTEAIRAIVLGGQPTFAAWTATHSLDLVPQSMQQMWTALQHDGTNHLELWLNQEYIKDGPDPLNVAVPATNTHSPHPAMVLQSTAPPPLHHLNHLHPRRRRRR